MINSTLNSKYEDVLDNLIITPDSLQYLSYLICGGEALGEVHEHPIPHDILGIILYKPLSNNLLP